MNNGGEIVGVATNQSLGKPKGTCPAGEKLSKENINLSLNNHVAFLFPLPVGPQTSHAAGVS